MSEQDWWIQNLDDYRQDGRKDAERGTFDAPHQLCECCPDPQDEAENEAYKHGFMERRAELGDKFRWADE